MAPTADPGPVCSSCGAAGPAEARFCPSCGGRLAAPVATPSHERERKQVTAMFVDIVGSMRLAKRIDDERWRDVLDGFFAAAGGAVHAVEGTVHQFTGDGIMALFGAPLAQEDHARRACLAALDVHRRVEPIAEAARADGVELRIRVGLHSGEVIVGLIGDDRQMDWAAIGHTTGVAKRVESLAPPGSTAVSAATAALVAGEFELGDLGTVPVKGVADAVGVRELLGRVAGVQGRVDAVLRGGGGRPMVGREPEEGVLDRALRATLDGDGRAIVLVGAAGVGKSRLAWEFAHRCRAEGTTVHRVVAEAHWRRLPLRPVLALLRSLFGITEHDEDAVARGRVDAVLAGMPAMVADDVALLLDFLGVPDPSRPAPDLSPEGRQRLRLALVARLVREVGRAGPVVLVCEDLHWFDDASRGYFAELVGAVAGTRVMLLGTARPEYTDDAREPRPHRLTLAPLAPRAARELLDGVLGRHPSVDGLSRLVADRAEGNPFFCEELVTALRESGHVTGSPGSYRLALTIEDLVLPATVQATLAARMDRLDHAAKRTLQDAAVVGTEFDEELLARLAPGAPAAVRSTLHQLVGAEMLTTTGEGRFAFQHPLTREVAYRTQLRGRRRAAHGRVAEVIATLYPDRLEELAALVAHHLEAAELPADAARWQTRAARWAERTSPHVGMSHWQAARRLADAAGPSGDRSGVDARIGILNQAWRVGVALHDMRTVHEEGLALLAGRPDPTSRLFLDWGRYAYLIFTGHEQEGYLVGLRNVALADEIGDPALILTTAAGSTYGAFLVGRVAEAIAMADRGLDAAGGDVMLGAGGLLANPYAHCLVVRAVCVCLTGDVATARDDLRRALSIAEEHDASEMATYAHWGLALVHTASGEAAAALAQARAALEIAGRGGNAWGQTMAQQAAAWGHLGTGDLDGAERACRQGLALIRSSGIGHHYEPVLRTALAATMLGSGRGPDGAAEVAAAATVAQQRGLSWAELPARLTQAHIFLADGGIEAATAALDRAATLAAESGVHLYDRALRSARRRCETQVATP